MDNYSQSYHSYFWQWEEGGTVLSIPNGNTIAYHSYVAEVLDALSLQGYPPFGALLLAIIATNPNNGKESVVQARNIINKHMEGLHHTTDFLANTWAFLDMLTDMPVEYKSGNKRKLLFQAIFEKCHHHLSPKKSIAILWAFKAGSNLTAIDATDVHWQRDLKPLMLLNERFPDVPSVLNKIASLPEIPEIPVDVPTEPSPAPAPQHNDFVDELTDNPKTFHIGALVRRIWGGLNIPFHNTMPSQQPLGGVSDITNKGNMDRLLVSEFANDDMTFLSRLANNEALYMNREVPPQNNNRERVILIDTSLRNWGTPRSIAFSVAVAIARHPKTNIRCLAFAVGETYTPLSLDSVHSIIDGLQCLSGCLNAAAGLELFFKEQKFREKEIIFVSSPDAIKYTPIQHVLNTYEKHIGYRIHTFADGRISLYKRQHNSLRHIQDIALNLAELWQPTKRQLPAHVSHEPANYPTLFALGMKDKQLLMGINGDFFVKDRDCIFHHGAGLNSEPHKGWQLIGQQLPGQLIEAGLSDAGDYICLLFTAHNKQHLVANLSTGTSKNLMLDVAKDFVFHYDRFYYTAHQSSWYISPDATVHENKDIDHGFFQALNGARDQKTNDVRENYNKNRYNRISILRRIIRIAIDGSNRLCINSHVLQITMQGFVFKQPKKQESGEIIEAQMAEEGVFVFSEGSSITVNCSGMIVLRSSNEEIPPIFIPAALETPLGIAAGNEFAGREYYYKDNIVNVTIAKYDEVQKPAVVNIIQTELDVPEMYAREMAASGAIKHISHVKAIIIRNRLSESGIPVDIQEVYTRLNQLNVDGFNRKYLQPFIHHIYHVHA